MVDVAAKLNDKSIPALHPRSVRVLPRDAAVAKGIKHPLTKVGFNKNDPSQSAEWPWDRFTRRRIADGTVTVVVPEPQPTAPEPATEQQHRRSRTHTE